MNATPEKMKVISTLIEDITPDCSVCGNGIDFGATTHQYLSMCTHCDTDFRKIDTMLNLERGWDSYDAPAPTLVAAEKAKEVLREIGKEGGETWRVEPSVIGGIGITSTYLWSVRYTEIYNDGQVESVTTKTQDGESLHDAFDKTKRLIVHG